MRIKDRAFRRAGRESTGGSGRITVVTPIESMNRISTGRLPASPVVTEHVEAAYARFRSVSDGHVADYIPALAAASPGLFGISVVGVLGRVFSVGDCEQEFSIQSVSKPFVFALVCEAIGTESARRRLGVNSTGLAFDSVMAVELNDERTMNAMVNAGAIAATSFVTGNTAEDKWRTIRDGLSRFAGRELALNDEVYASESATNLRNRGIAHLLQGYGRLGFEPDLTTDVYTRQCSLDVTVTDLAVMAATLADGGVNPVTGEAVVSEESCRATLAALATAGLYERSGDWLFDVGLPGKSGVSGSIVTVAPGKGGMAVYSPPLDEAGNSVRGQLVTQHLSHALGLNLFASEPAPREAR
jgi:glutaminase